MILKIKGYVREKNKYWYTVIAYYEDDKEKRQWRSTGLSVKNNKRRAQSIMEERLREFEKEAEEQNRLQGWGLDVHTKDLLFADLMNQWMERKERALSPATVEGYRRILHRAEPFFRQSGVAVKDVTPALIERYLRFLEDEVRPPISPNTMRKHLVLLRSVFSEYIKDGVLMYNPAKRVAMPKPIPYEAQTYSADEIRSLMEKLEGNELQDVVYLAAFYGLRRSEVSGIRWEDIDFENRCLYIRHKILETHLDGEHQLLQTNQLKTEASRRTYRLTESMVKRLLERRQRVTESQKLWGNSYDHTYDAYVFVLQDGSLLTPDKISNRFRSFIKNNNPKKIIFHDLRHSCATMLLREGFTLQEIQRYLGHAAYQTTLRYAHLDTACRSSASDRMENLIAERSEK